MPTSSVWQRLSSNRSANAPAFRRACIEFEDIQSLTCPACGVEESALFWSPAADRTSTLHLICPICGETRGRYDLRRNRASNPWNAGRIFVRGGIGALLLLIVTLLLVQSAPAFSTLRERSGWAWQYASAAADDAKERAGDTIRRIAGGGSGRR